MDSDVESVARRARMHELLGTWSGVPAFFRDRYLTIVASNALAVAVSPAFAEGVNVLRAAFLSPLVDRNAAQWPAIAAQATGLLRDSIEQHDDDDDGGFRDLVGELSTRSQDFSAAWADDSDDVQHSAQVQFVVAGGETLTLVYQQLRVPEEYDEVLVVWRPADQASRIVLDRLAASLRTSEAEGPAAS